MNQKRFPSFFLTAALAACLWSSATASSALAQTLTTDKPDYAPGETAYINGTGYVPGEVVMLQVLHADPTHPSDGEDHEPWGVFADNTGAIAATWHVCEDDCVGETLRASGQGMSCWGGYAEVLFTDAANDGNGVVTITSPNGSCVSGNGGNVYQWNVVQGGLYTMTITGVTECSGDNIKVFVQGSSTGNFCFDLAKLSAGVYQGEFAMPNPACATYPISYKCDVNGACDRDNSFRARGPDGANTVHLRASTFDGSCQNPVTDEDCKSCTCTGVPTLVNVPAGAQCDGNATIFDLGCNPDLATLPQCDPNVTAFDNCGPVEVICGVSEVVDGCFHTRRIFYDAANACGISKCVIAFRWVCDTNAPLLSAAGPNQTIDCSAELVFTPPTATDLCTGATVSQVGSDTVVPGSCAGNYTITRAWIAVDGCGNATDPVTQTLTVHDTTAPSIGGQGANHTVGCGDALTFVAPTATDDCSGVLVVPNAQDTLVPGNCAGNYSVTRSWTAVDGCGNVSEPVSQTITVQDTTAPAIGAAGANTTVQCGDVLPFVAPTAVDDCSGVTVHQVGNDQPVPGNCAGNYSVTRTWQAVDGCGNTSALVSQTITVQDTTAPTITPAGADATIACTDTPAFTPPTANDSCSGVTVEVVSTQTSNGNCAGNYSVTRTWRAVDGCGNASAPVSQTITVQDLTGPTITPAGADATIACTETPSFTPPTANDDCSGATVEVVSTQTADGNCAGNYSVTRTWRAVDGCGNASAPVSQTITVQDLTGPTISPAGANATIACTDTPSFTPPTANDDCSGATVEVVSTQTADGNCAGNYSVTRTWRAVDGCGNASAPVSQTITVQDLTGPTISPAGADATIDCSATLAFTPPTANDDCSGATVEVVSTQTADGNCAGNYSVTRTWRAVDGCGNASAPVSQTITVQDTTPPTLGPAGPDHTIACTASPDFTAPTATDDCSGATVSQVGTDAVTAGNCAGNYLLTRTWGAVDGCGNASGTVSQTIAVQDTVGPVVVCPPNLNLNAGGGCTVTIGDLVLGTPTATDDCSGVAITTRNPTIVTFPLGDTTVTWTVTDGCGNSTSCDQTVSVKGQVCASKFYDANANGVKDVGEAPVEGWKFQLLGPNAPPAGVTGPDGTVCFDAAVGNYSLVEVSALQTNWVATTPTTRPVTVGQQSCNPSFEFGNYCFRAPTGGRTLGFWGNPNGKMLLASAQQTLGNQWRVVLNGLNLRNANGTPFTISLTSSFEDAYRSLKVWLNGATATNMAYMLSAQLASTTLSVNYGGLSDNQLVVIPGGVKSGANVCTVPLLSQAQALTCAATPLLSLTSVAGSASCGCVSNDGLVKVADVRARAICLLGSYGNTTAAGLPRTYEEGVKNLLDMFNNNGNNGYACGGITQFVNANDDTCPISFQ